MSLAATERFLARQSRWRVLTFSLLLVALFGVADHFTGFELSFAVFYLLPIMLAAWYGGRPAGLLVCAVSAAVWLVVDYSAGNHYSQAWIAYWNASTRLALFVAVAHLLSRLKQTVENQQNLLARDALTGVNSLRAFEEQATRMFALAARNRRSVALGFVDLDGFKALNDTRGHAEGDRALVRVGAELNRLVRVSDIAARIGGDEFVVLLTQVEREGAEVFFARLHSHLSSVMNDNGWPVGFSIGLAVFTNAAIDVKTALRHADGLMYKAKKTGRNTIVCEVFDAGPSDADPAGSARRNP